MKKLESNLFFSACPLTAFVMYAIRHAAKVKLRTALLLKWCCTQSHREGRPQEAEESVSIATGSSECSDTQPYSTGGGLGVQACVSDGSRCSASITEKKCLHAVDNPIKRRILHALSRSIS